VDKRGGGDVLREHSIVRLFPTTNGERGGGSLLGVAVAGTTDGSSGSDAKEVAHGRTVPAESDLSNGPTARLSMFS
jgi:hypothetical protein